MQNTISTEQLTSLRGAPVYSAEGEEIGTVEELFVDQATSRPEWIATGTGFLGTKRVLVPVVGAEIREGGLYVPYGKSQVKDTPDIDEDRISQEAERQLYAHYGLDYSEQRSETGLPEGASSTPPGGASEAEVVRTEEELNVGKREVEAGTVRLRKWVETTPVEADVELQRETVRVEREPLDQPVGAGEIGEQEVEVPLRAEEAVVQKEAVAKERISLEKDVATEQATVSEEVRKERVEVEDEGSSR